MTTVEAKTPREGGTYIIAYTRPDGRRADQFWNAETNAWVDRKDATLYSWAERYEAIAFVMPAGGEWWVIL